MTDPILAKPFTVGVLLGWVALGQAAPDPAWISGLVQAGGLAVLVWYLNKSMKAQAEAEDKRREFEEKRMLTRAGELEKILTADTKRLEMSIAALHRAYENNRVSPKPDPG